MPTDGGVLRDGDLVLRPLAGGGGASRAQAFAVEVGGVTAGQGRVCSVAVAGRSAPAGPQIDLQLGRVWWKGLIAARAARLLTRHAFTAGAQAVFALNVAGEDAWAFRANRYVPWRRSAVPGRRDLVCREAYFTGRAAAAPHRGPDGVRAAEQPHGALVVVHRRAPAMEVLVLHRAGLGEAEDWAWTPPSGARFPAEPIDGCAARELNEETGLDAAPLRLAGVGSARWPVYALEVGADAVIDGGGEHDRHAWLPAREALCRCRPGVVRASLAAALASLRP